MRRLALSLVLVLAAALPALADDDPAPIFGPKTYERTSGPPDSYSDTITAPAAAPYLMWIQNGDDDGGRVSSATITVNGATIIGSNDLSDSTEQFARIVPLNAGDNALVVSVDGSPGTSLTIVVGRLGDRPVFSVGRLVVPYASASDLVIALKNGARHGRAVRLFFLAPDGTLAAKSDKIVLPPHGSVSKSVLEWVTSGTFTEGSVEIVYAGRGVGRLFGSAVVKDAVTNVSSIEEIQHAGYRAWGPGTAFPNPPIRRPR